MKTPIFLWTIFLFLWIFLGRSCCPQLNFVGDSSSECPVSMVDGERKVYQSENNFNFHFSDTKPNISAAATRGLEKLAIYLVENKERGLIITGHYTEEEKVEGIANLGLERAKEVKSYLGFLGAPSENITTQSSQKKDLEFINNKTCQGVSYAFKKNKNTELFIVDGDTFSAKSKENLTFGISDNNFTEPISEEVKTVFTDLGRYLEENKNKTIEVIGQYRQDETNSTAFPDLGRARANRIKELLVRLGAPSAQIELNSKVVTKRQITFDNDKQVGMSSFSFIEGKMDKLEEIKARLTAGKLILYFESSAETLDLTTEQRQFFLDINYYLDRVSDAKIVVEGHTDNEGGITLNQRLSRKRAEFVQAYLMKNGIREKQSQISFQGADRPIADNATSEGRAQNRRVEVYLQK